MKVQRGELFVIGAIAVCAGLLIGAATWVGLPLSSLMHFIAQSIAVLGIFALIVLGIALMVIAVFER